MPRPCFPGDDMWDRELCLPCLFVLEWWCMCGDSCIEEPEEEVDEADGDTEAGEMVGVIVVLKWCGRLGMNCSVDAELLVGPLAGVPKYVLMLCCAWASPWDNPCGYGEYDEDGRGETRTCFCTREGDNKTRGS